MITLAELRQKTLELLGDTAEGSSQFAPGGDTSRLDKAIQWAQEQIAERMETTFYQESAMPVGGIMVPSGPLQVGSIFPFDQIDITRVAAYPGPSPVILGGMNNETKDSGLVLGGGNAATSFGTLVPLTCGSPSS